MKLNVFTNNSYVNKTTGEASDTVLMRLRGSKEGATLRVKKDSFKALPEDWDTHDGLAIEVSGTPRLSASKEYVDYPAAEVIDYRPGAGISGKEVDEASALAALAGLKD